MTQEFVTNRPPSSLPNTQLRNMGAETITIKHGDKTVVTTPERLEQVARTMEEKLYQDRIDLSNAEAAEQTEQKEQLGPRRVSGEALLSALKYVWKSLPKPKEQPDIAYLIVHHDTDKKRIVLSARDGCRWHEAYIEAPEQLSLITSALEWESVNNAKRWLDNAVKACASTTVEIETALCWSIHYNGPAPIELEFQRLYKTPTDWQLPSFVAPKPGEANGGVINGYQSKHMADAQTWTGGACVRRDDPDSAGRRHLVLVDPSGDLLARAVVCPLGMTDGLPDSKQTEIDSTLSPPGVANAKRAKAKASKSKTVTVQSSRGTNKTVNKTKASKGKGNGKKKSK